MVGQAQVLARHQRRWAPQPACGHIETLARNLKPSAESAPSFSAIRIEGGTVILRDEAYRIVETLTEVEFALAWPSISKSFAATGRFTWNAQPIDAIFSFADFKAALQGDRSGLKIRLAGTPFKLGFDGYISKPIDTRKFPEYVESFLKEH